MATVAYVPQQPQSPAGGQLAVTRYVYKGLDAPSDFPVSARWDWKEENGKKILAMGVRCGLGWCLIGGKATGVAGSPTVRLDECDPDDPLYPICVKPPKPGDPAGAAATSDPVPNFRRVRGFYDKLPDPQGTAAYYWIYPDQRTANANDDVDFEKGRFLPQFAIRFGVGNPKDDPSERRVGVGRPQLFGFLWRRWRMFETWVYSPGESHIEHRSFAGSMPAAARWGTSHIVFDVPPNGDKKIFALQDASVWIRCATGCCSANVAF